MSLFGVVPRADRQLRLLDLFAGCGGLTEGFLTTGCYRVVGAVERDADAAATYSVNHGDHVHPGDIADWLRGSLPLAEVVVGGPPCQGFSALGRRDADDPRNALWQRYVDVLVRVRPAMFVLENVPQFLDGPEFAALVEATETGGRLHAWEVEAHVFDASRYGVAQARKRAFVIGRPRGARALGRPTEDAGQRTLADELVDVPPVVTDVDLPDCRVVVHGRSTPGSFATRDLHFTGRPSAISQERYRWIPPGGNRWDLPDRLKLPAWRGEYRGAADVMGRLRWDRPAVTLRTEFFRPEKGRFLHPDQNRALTHFEAARLQGFPDDYLWCGSKASIARQIGNAVPVPLASAVGRHLAAVLT